MSTVLGKHFGNQKNLTQATVGLKQLDGGWRALNVLIGRQRCCPTGLAVIRSGRAGRRCYRTPLCSFYPCPSPAFPGQSIFQTLLYPIPAASFLALPSLLIITALNSPRLVLSRCNGHSAASLHLCVSMDLRPRVCPEIRKRCWQSHTAPSSPSCATQVFGCNIQPPGSLLGGISPRPPARQLCSSPLEGAGSAARAGNSPG